MRAEAVLGDLVAAAGLPRVVHTGPAPGHAMAQGLDNDLLQAELSDGRVVLLRRSKQPAPAPWARANFLAANKVGAPHLHAADDAGTVLVDYV